ncbi:rod-binding protein [Eubacterium oxidoreducens]|uniref:Rod binding protein n=1 Tax=Eubacterium oxidoreducens TaxID=1732 RepID=A0A1G6ACW4_EUBOX|nr:rod-binding protein [Eubacterium oxidoreducens]SDB06219.1 Rod binding protein [Eubacterium oxidoreducens]
MGISLDSLTSLYSGQATDASSTTNALENELTNTDYSNSTSEELMDVCKQFEAYFLEQIFKGMEATVPETESSSNSMSSLTDYYKDMTIQQVASDATEQGDGVGLAKMLYEQMKRNYGIED